MKNKQQQQQKQQNNKKKTEKSHQSWLELLPRYISPDLDRYGWPGHSTPVGIPLDQSSLGSAHFVLECCDLEKPENNRRTERISALP